MDGRTLTGKTVTFAIVCVFFALFVMFFGTAHAMLGIITAVAAMLMLGKDMSSRPVSNIVSLAAFMIFLGIGAFLASLNPYLGVAVNFCVVFLTVFSSMQDLKSPMHFPLLLFYAVMVIIPVTAEELPNRLLSLMSAAVFVVALNVLINRGSRRQMSHRGVAAVCREIAVRAREAMDGGAPDAAELERLCTDLNRGLYDRLKGHFFTSPRDRTLLDLVVSLMDLGRAVCLRERSRGCLGDIVSFMETVESHELGGAPLEEVRTEADRLIASNPDADLAVRSSVRDVATGLAVLESPKPRQGMMIRSMIPDIMASVREEARHDSARFTFAVRMALMFSLVAFASDYWDWISGQVLLFTVIALLVPYLEDAWQKTVMRLTGTVIGAAVFAAVLILFQGNSLSLAVLALLSGYLYTVLGGGRYDHQMLFFTMVVLAVSALTSPDPDADVLERIVFTLAGALVAIVANRVILPYRISDGNTELVARSLANSHRRIVNIRECLAGADNSADDARHSVVSAGMSQKMMINAEKADDPLIRRFQIRQDSLSIQCSSLYKSIGGMSPLCRQRVSVVIGADLESDEPLPYSDISGLGSDEAELVMAARRIVLHYRMDRRLMYDIIVAGYMRGMPDSGS